jgi:drug/metabolite transporter (DMT)-like permease
LGESLLSKVLLFFYPVVTIACSLLEGVEKLNLLDLLGFGLSYLRNLKAFKDE